MWSTSDFSTWTSSLSILKSTDVALRPLGLRSLWLKCASVLRLLIFETCITYPSFAFNSDLIHGDWRMLAVLHHTHNLFPILYSWNFSEAMRLWSQASTTETPAKEPQPCHAVIMNIELAKVPYCMHDNQGLLWTACTLCQGLDKHCVMGYCIVGPQIEFRCHYPAPKSRRCHQCENSVYL